MPEHDDGSCNYDSPLKIRHKKVYDNEIYMKILPLSSKEYIWFDMSVLVRALEISGVFVEAQKGGCEDREGG